MVSIFEKLNLKEHTSILVLHSPKSFLPALKTLKGITVYQDARSFQGASFVLAFVTTQDQIKIISKIIAKNILGDAIVWMAYPKGTSKKYQCDFNRDTGWDPLGKIGFERVRQVAIDEDWSALRFRRVEFIKTMIRKESFALTDRGKRKARKVG